MNINPNAAASVAGTSRAAARGGDTDAKVAESTRQQSTAETPGGNQGDGAVDAGEQADDRHGDGRQTLDVFERSESSDEHPSGESEERTRRSASTNGSGTNLDLEA